MNKKLKHIIAATIVISTFITIIPRKYVNLGMVNAYASSNISKDEFQDMTVRKGEGEKELQFYNSSSCSDSDKVNFKFDNKTYYVKISGNTNSINISANIDSYYEAYVFKGNNEKPYSLEQEIPAPTGMTTLYLRIYEAGEFDDRDIQNNVIKTYKIYVKNDSDSEKKNNFNENSNNGNSNINENDNTNKIEIPQNNNKKYNQWISINGSWQYIDFNGNSLKNQWHNDKTTGKWYYLDGNGNMKTGWMQYGDSWYHFDTNGAMHTGWLLCDGDWYYLNSNGTLFTGWLQNGEDWYFLNRNTGIMKNNGWIVDNGKYYYFTSSGKMLTNATINGYTLGKDGSWIGK